VILEIGPEWRDDPCPRPSSQQGDCRRDRSELVKILREKTADFSNIIVIEGDILKSVSRSFIARVISSSRWSPIFPIRFRPLLFGFIESRDLFSTLTLMLQREVAERMIASLEKGLWPFINLTQSVQISLFSSISNPLPFFLLPRSNQPSSIWCGRKDLW